MSSLAAPDSKMPQVENPSESISVKDRKIERDGLVEYEYDPDIDPLTMIKPLAELLKTKFLWMKTIDSKMVHEQDKPSRPEFYIYLEDGTEPGLSLVLEPDTAQYDLSHPELAWAQAWRRLLNQVENLDPKYIKELRTEIARRRTAQLGIS